MEDIKILNEGLTSIREEEDAKKIKVTEQNFKELIKSNEEAKLEEMRSAIDAIITEEEKKIEEEPVIEEKVNMFNEVEDPVVDEETPITEEPEAKTEETDDFEADLEKEVEPFAYHYEEPEEEVSEEAINQIKELGDAYKGQPKTDFSKIMETVPVKEETKVTPEDFEGELNKESYSPKIHQFKENMKAEYEQLKAKIEANKEELNRLKHAIKDAEDISSNLKEQLTEPLSIVDKINGLDLAFLSDKVEENEEARIALQSMGVLYNSTRDIATNLQDKLKENIANIKGLKTEEEKTIQAGVNLKEEKERFETEKYEELVKLNAKDDNLKADDEEISAITGIKEVAVAEAAPVNEELPETNIFESKRVYDEEPKVVTNVESYGDAVNQYNARIA